MSGEEKKQIKEEKELNSSRKNTDSKKEVFDGVEDEFDKEDPNFDSIDFNMNPFNNNNDITSGEKHKDSDDFILSKREDKNIQMNNDYNDNFNLKLNIYSDTWKNPSMNPNPENISINLNNNNYKNIFNNVNMNKNIQNNNMNFINSKNEPEIKLNKNTNNTPIGFNNNVINNNVFNIGYDLKAAPFLPKNNNIQINPNINNININSSNNNTYLFSKGLPSWICPICRNYNSRGKLQSFLYNIILYNIVEQICNRCGNINSSSFPDKNYSASNLPFVLNFEKNFPSFSPVNDNSGSIPNTYITNSYADQTQNQHDKGLFSKNTKKNKKSKKNNNPKYKDKRPFDWICNRCNNLNYSFRTFCNICNLPKSQNVFYNTSMRNSN